MLRGWSTTNQDVPNAWAFDLCLAQTKLKQWRQDEASTHGLGISSDFLTQHFELAKLSFVQLKFEATSSRNPSQHCGQPFFPRASWCSAKQSWRNKAEMVWGFPRGRAPDVKSIYMPAGIQVLHKSCKCVEVSMGPGLINVNVHGMQNL